MKPCQECRHDNETDARFCDRCGAPFAAAAELAGGAPRAAEDGGRPLLLLGGAPDVDLTVAHGSVSGHHAVVWRDFDGVMIHDLGSTNGTCVDGRRIERPTPLAPTAQVRLGAHELDAQQLITPLGSAPRGHLVGRHPACDAVFDAPVVSSRHLLVRPLSDSDLLVMDCGSSNGTAVSSRTDRIARPAQVSESDVLYLGSLRLPVKVLRERLRAAGAGAQAVEIAADQPLVLGRAPDCDVVVAFPQVSARHARVTPLPDGSYRVEDLGSSNGTFVNGVAIKSATLSAQGSLSLGSCPIKLLAGRKPRPEPLAGACRIDATQINRVVRHRKTGDPLNILCDVSFSAYPSSLVGLMGPSGSGKTTLLLALNGYERPTSGQVFINGDDLYANFDRYRGVVGYVPQDDIIHRQLTVAEALYYTARLRLPPDTGDTEINQRIDEVLASLKLTEQRDQVIGSVEDKVLSGGQRKRVNLAQELITDPAILFLDEPTSGLSSRDAADVMEVLRKLADEGRTVIVTIHQPSPEIYARMDEVITLAGGGRLAYFGPTVPESYAHFGLSDERPDHIMDCLEDESPEVWQRRYQESPLHEEFVVKRLASRGETTSEPHHLRTASDDPWSQGATLLRRFAVTKLRDTTNLAILALQVPIVGALLAFLFHGAPPDDRRFPLFLIGMSALFFGCFNACREIVAERAILRRERMVNLRALPYVASKFLGFGVIGVLQVALLFLIGRVWIGLEGDAKDYMAVLSLTILGATAMGLAISAVVRSAEAAMTIVPIILLFQLALAGFVVGLERDEVRLLAAPMKARWATEGLLEAERRALSQTVTPAPAGVSAKAPGRVGGARPPEVPQHDATAHEGRRPDEAQFRAFMENRGYGVDNLSRVLAVLAGLLAAGLGLALGLVAARDRPAC